MPAVDETRFASREVIATTTDSGQSAASRIGSANASLPSGAVPACSSTKPPKIERAADPEPRRARIDSSLAVASTPAAAQAATARAANPEADDARPAPVGKLLVEVTVAAERMPARSRTRSSIRLARPASARSPSS